MKELTSEVNTVHTDNQTEKHIYKEYVDILLNKGAYMAFDTPAELDAKRAEIENFQYDASTRGLMKNS